MPCGVGRPRAAWGRGAVSVARVWPWAWARGWAGAVFAAQEACSCCCPCCCPCCCLDREETPQRVVRAQSGLTGEGTRQQQPQGQELLRAAKHTNTQAEQSRAEQSRAEQSRAHICYFLLCFCEFIIPPSPFVPFRPIPSAQKYINRKQQKRRGKGRNCVCVCVCATATLTINRGQEVREARCNLLRRQSGTARVLDGDNCL